VLGGISSGADIVVRAAVKPTPSLASPQQTVDIHGQPQQVSTLGRHDPCICPRLVPVAEAMVALVLADAMLRQRAVEQAEVDQTDLLAGMDRLEDTLLQAAGLRAQLRRRLANEAGLLGQKDTLRQKARQETGEAVGLPLGLTDRLFALLDGV
jgi:hypothetical protein